MFSWLTQQLGLLNKRISSPVWLDRKLTTANKLYLFCCKFSVDHSAPVFCIVMHYCCWFLIVESYIVLFTPFFLDVLFSVPSLQIQLYSCCFSHSSGFGSVECACVKKVHSDVFFGCGWIPEGVCIWGCVCQLGVLLVFVYRLVVCIPRIGFCTFLLCRW